MPSSRLDLTLYLVTDASLCGSRGILETARLAVAGGATIVQLRDPHAPARRLVEEARALVSMLRPRGIPVIVNDRVDVALAADADGVHIGQTDIGPSETRQMLGPSRILGLSAGTLDELAVSNLDGVDYLGVGPVFGTQTKADAGDAIGPAGLAAVRARTRVPIVGIGRIDATNAAEVIDAGADGVAVVSAICAAADPEDAARRIVSEVRCARAALRPK